MAVAIRLRREGNRNNAFYRVVVADSRSPRDGRFIEMLGTYDPHQDHGYQLDLERVDYWLSCGAQPSETVNSLIKRARKGDGTPPSTAKLKEKQERAKAAKAEEAAKAAAEEKAAAEAKKAEEEAAKQAEAAAAEAATEPESGDAGESPEPATGEEAPKAEAEPEEAKPES